MPDISDEDQIDLHNSSIGVGQGLLSSPAASGRQGRSRIYLIAAIAAVLWTLLVSLTAYLNIHQHQGDDLEMARQVAEAYFRKDQAFRFWGAKHGGVYVPVTEETPPNEYLTNIPEREILTPSGRRLTLMNPAYMMRQINEDFAELYGSAAHLTSLMPLDPDNTPDPWERKALLMFEKGAEVVTEVVGEGEDQTLRLMRPMMVSRPCLKCHESQGYREGDVRGGLSVSLPLSQFQQHTAGHEQAMVLSYGLIWLLGIGVILLIAWRGSRVAKERAQSQAKLINAHNYTREVISSLGEGLYGVDREGRLVFLNPAGERILGWKEEELIGRSVHNAIHHSHEDGSPYSQEECPLLQVLSTGVAYASNEDHFVRKDGSLFPVSYISTPIYDGNRVSGAVMAFQDITARREDEAQIRYLAHHDPLTSLPNRALLLELLAHGVAQAKRYGHSIAVLFVDLDDFSLINDTLGHSLGDELLRQVASRLRELIREPDILARQGGDEFIVMICNQPCLPGEVDGEEATTFSEHALTVGKRLLQALEQPFRLQETELTLSASIGISLYPEDAATPEVLLQHADSAMYHAKGQGKRGMALFAGELSERLARRHSLEQSLRKALDKGELSVCYQPQVRLSDRQTVGFEALLRWNSPEHGRVSPAEFIPIAENNGLIVPIGTWVLDQACAQAAAWRKAGYSFYVAVNISLRQFLRGHLEEMVWRAIDGADIPPQALELEITESTAAYDPQQAERVMHRLSQAGMRLALDDFGTGYSSLSRLRALPIRTLKVDKSFIDGLPTESDDVQIVSSTVQLAHSLGKRSLAEGIETEEQHQFLLQLGCMLGQGYLYSPPMPEEQIPSWIAQSCEAVKASTDSTPIRRENMQ